MVTSQCFDPCHLGCLPIIFSIISGKQLIRTCFIYFFNNFFSRKKIKITCLAMTTNERINADRYRYFKQNKRSGNIHNPYK